MKGETHFYTLVHDTFMHTHVHNVPTRTPPPPRLYAHTHVYTYNVYAYVLNNLYIEESILLSNASVETRCVKL